MNRSSSKKYFKRNLLERCIPIVFAISCYDLCLPSVYGQFNEGDLPASPWSNKMVRQATDTRDRSLSSGATTISQPRTLGQTAPGQPTLGQPTLGQLVKSPVAEKTKSRPASVTLLGPMAPPNKTSSRQLNNNTSLAPNDDSNPSLDVFEPGTSKQGLEHSSVSPQHTRTQNRSIEAQSDWQRVQAGGIEIDDQSVESGPESNDDVFPLIPSVAVRSQRRGLPDRIEETSPSTAPSHLASNTSVVPVGPIQLPFEDAFEKPRSENSPVEISAARESLLASPSATSPQEASKNEAALVRNAPILDESEMQRIALAKRVSFELTSQNPYPPARAPDYLEAPPGWGAVEQELHERLTKCDSLLKRNAFHSAREEATQGLRRLCRTMDAHRRTLSSSPALEKAITSLREEADFQNIHQIEAVQSLVASHSTEALKGRPLDSVSPEIASQHYRTFARYQFVVAADRHPWAADLLYAYGKTLEKEAELDSSRAFFLRNQAVTCYQSAMQVSPNQIEVGNQLGYALITLDRIDEAYQALSTSLNNKPTAGAWNNMAEIYRRRGAPAYAEYAVQQANAIASSQPQFSYDNPHVTEVDPATFAKYSPMPLQTSSSTNNQPSVASGNSATAVRQASANSSFFSKIFKR
ncbi:MAG: hypothetical protein ABL921_00520 [Pirellula sp.]